MFRPPLCAVIIGLCFALTVPAADPPAKITWSDDRVELDDVIGGLIHLTATPDAAITDAEIRLTASLADFVAVVSPAGLFSAGAEEAVDVVLEVLVMPDDAGRTLGGTVQVREADRTLAKPLGISLKRTPGEGEEEEEEESEEGSNPLVTWDPGVLTEENFSRDSASVEFTADEDLANVSVWLTGSLKNCLTVEEPTEFALVSAGNPVELDLTLSVPVDELSKRCNGTIHVRGTEPPKRTYPGVLMVRIGAAGEEDDDLAPVLPEAVTDAASFKQGPVAPGQIVSIFGESLGPEEGQGFAPPSNGRIGTEIDGVVVMFDGIPAPMLYTLAGQINTIVPAAVKGGEAELVIIVDGEPSTSFPLPLGPYSPSLFTATGTGHGQSAAINQNGSLNSSEHPAPKGSAVSFFGTGGGPTNPPLDDGELAPFAPLPLEAPVEITIGGVPATVLYAGGAPGLVNGVVQWNAEIPQGLPPGPHAVVITINGVAGGPHATVEVE